MSILITDSAIFSFHHCIQNAGCVEKRQMTSWGVGKGVLGRNHVSWSGRYALTCRRRVPVLTFYIYRKLWPWSQNMECGGEEQGLGGVRLNGQTHRRPRKIKMRWWALGRGAAISYFRSDVLLYRKLPHLLQMCDRPLLLQKGSFWRMGGAPRLAS